MSPTDQVTFFYYGDGVGSEVLARYTAQGFHPVLLGDILPKSGTCVDDRQKQPRYRIAQKLGHGAFSTVWLARDLSQDRLGGENPGQNHIIEVFDIFTIQGPNGFHECIVMEVVVPFDDAPIRRKYSALHGANKGCVDPHYANFGIAIPQLQQFDEEVIADYFAAPVVMPVVPRDPLFPRDSVPSYLTETVSLGSFLQDQQCFPSEDQVCVKILDFGRAHWTDKVPRELPGAAPPTIRPPEVYMHELSDGKMGSVWSKAADVWAIGCILYLINAGCQLLLVQGDSQYQLYKALQLGGAPPKDWSEYWDLEKFCESTRDRKNPMVPSFDIDGAWDSRRPTSGLKDEDVLDIIRQMVVTDPTKRMQLAIALEHAIFSPQSGTEQED
ncbi:serine threonine kinase [Cordyceps militaris]|uniref:Serine threonine kinase n=1 Tax=Cordyceps militaris TaxID=73501 RepID=A0A2H4SH44_CORMI|nr:serine threonine kinase [Cordyceps militaris]